MNCRTPHILLAMALLSLAPAALADSQPFASTSSLDAPARAQLDAAIANAKALSPQSFDGVRRAIARAGALDHGRRGRFYPMTPMFREIARASAGRPGASLALLEPLLFPERFTLPSASSALIALRAGLLEAAGDLADPAAAPVYRTIIANGTEFYEVRAAVEALGKLGQDSDVAMLSHLATTSGPKQDAAIGGIGACRRVAAARALGTLAKTSLPPSRAKLLLSSLGTMASSWALATPHAAPAAERDALRAAAAEASLAVYVAAAGEEVRAAASDAIMTIDAPTTNDLILAARSGASRETSLRLDALSIRFAHNPTRTR